MQIIASLRKRTKSGVSVWQFCYDKEMDAHFAVGGEDLKVIRANDRKHLRTIYTNFKRYGYAEKLAPKRVYINDPWSSEMPAGMQMQLEALSA